MKIIQVITLTELGGAQTVVANLSNKLCENNEVIVIAGEGDGALWGLLDNRITKIECPTLMRSISPVNDLKTVGFLRRINKLYKPDVIHLHSSKAGLLGRIAFPSKKVIYTVHGFDSIRLAYRKFLPLEKIMQHFCKAIIGVSAYDKENLINENITRNVDYVYNGIYKPQLNISTPLPDTSSFSKTILCIARLSKQKNHQLFIDVAKANPQYAFVWIGNLENVDNLPNNCFFLGNIPNAAAYYSRADLCILTSNYEGLPMTIIEAMSLGKPVVSSNVGGVKEIVRDGVNGYLSDNTVDCFSTCIAKVFSSDSHYSEMCKKSEEIFNAELTVDKMVSGYINVYTK